MNQCLVLILLASPSAAFLLLIFGPCTFKFLVKFAFSAAAAAKSLQHSLDVGQGIFLSYYHLEICCILKIPWTEEPGRLQSMGS